MTINDATFDLIRLVIVILWVVLLLMFLYFTFLLLYSEILSLKSSRQAGILVISLYNLHGDGVEHSDKTLLLEGVWRIRIL